MFACVKIALASKHCLSNHGLALLLVVGAAGIALTSALTTDLTKAWMPRVGQSALSLIATKAFTRTGCDTHLLSLGGGGGLMSTASFTKIEHTTGLCFRSKCNEWPTIASGVVTRPTDREVATKSIVESP
jgi:hypothetical protein